MNMGQFQSRRGFFRQVCGLMGSALVNPSDASTEGAKSVRDFGAVGDGVADDSRAILEASRSGLSIYFPSGVYRFTSGVNPVFGRGVFFEHGARIDGAHHQDIFKVDVERGLLVGLAHNHLEEDCESSSGFAAIRTGYFYSPPTIGFSSDSSSIDVIAHWYNDFGLEATRLAQGNKGALTWYSWSWAFRSRGKTYDASRHPFLGWYRGDDPAVLDWQCFWLTCYGIRVVNLAGVIDFSAWESPSSLDYWKYVLFNKVHNFKNLNYLLWVPTRGSLHDLERKWFGVIDAMQHYSNCYCIPTAAEKCPVVYVFEYAELVRSFGGNLALLVHFFLKCLMYAKSKRFCGLVVFARNYDYSLDRFFGQLNSYGFYIFRAGYSEISGAGRGDYIARIRSAFSLSAQNEVINIATAMVTSPPHPSGWTVFGSSPNNFERLFDLAVMSAKSRFFGKKIVQIYNVSEWAEGGPGLQPDHMYGFGYLQAVKNVLTKS